METFEDLLEKVTPRIQRTAINMREPVSAAERLSVTLRFLASGNSYQDLEYFYRIPKCTLSYIIPETCAAIYEMLKTDYLKMATSEDDWASIEEGFKNRWNFPNCCGALDGKHVVITPPTRSGSAYRNYKQTFSIILMTLVDSDYKFSFIDVGDYGRVGDSGVVTKSSLGKAMENKRLKFPPPKPLPGRNKEVPSVIVGDEAFPLKPNLMRPFPSRSLNKERRIFNYRLSRARRIVENAFGILANRFGIFKKAIPLSPEKVEILVLVACALHNFLRSTSGARNIYTPHGYIDTEDKDGKVIKGKWRNDDDPEGIVKLATQGGNHSSRSAKEVQAELCEHFYSNGQVPWQLRICFMD